MYRVFLGAPTRAVLLSDQPEHATYEWHTVSSSTTPRASAGSNNSVLISTHDYEAVSIRILEFYQNTIFHDDEPLGDGEYADPTTVFPWPPTPVAEGDSELIDESRANMTTAPSFLLPRGSAEQIETQPTFDSLSVSQSLSHSYTRSNMSCSIAHFPSFNFNPNILSPLSLLARAPRRVSFLVAVLEMDGPDKVTIKNGPDAGKEVAILRMIVGDEEGRVAKLTAWRDVAEKWGGETDGEDGSTSVKRGDVVLIENVNGTKTAETSPALTASPYLGSRLTICYRTLPRENRDQRLRPDLRLGASDAAVRRVADVVRWFENMAGL